MPPVVLMLAAAPTNASTSASFVTSADATAPVAVASAPTASTLASAYALLRPRAWTVSDAASTATSGIVPSNDAVTPPRTFAVGVTMLTLIVPPPLLEPVAVAVLPPVARTCTAPDGTVSVALDATDAFTSAALAISASELMPLALPKIPMDTTADVAVAVLPPVAWTVTPLACVTSADSDALTAPLICARGKLTPAATTPPAPPSDDALAVLPPVAVSVTTPVELMLFVVDGADAVTSAPLLIVASAPEPESDTTPMPMNSVSACA